MDKLLKLLSENSGFTTAEIAAMLGEPEDYIKAQIKEYENSGVIKGYQAVVNWDMVDDSYVEALIELQVTPKKETGFDEMAELCMGFEEVHTTLLSLYEVSRCRISQCLLPKSFLQLTVCFQRVHTLLCVATRTEERASSAMKRSVTGGI
jgi:DNA-binding Lrp family transcriptional regulator